MQKGSVNIRALFLHNLSDALASVAVVAGGTLILLYDWRLVDPLVTIGIAVTFSACRSAKSAGRSTCCG